MIGALLLLTVVAPPPAPALPEAPTSGAARLAEDEDESDPLAAILFAIAEPTGLTLEAVVRRAVLTAPRLEQVEARAGAAAAERGRAVAGLIPRVNLLARYARLSEVQNPTLFPGPTVGEVERLRGLAAEVEDDAARMLWMADLDRLEAQLAADRFPVFVDQWTAQVGLEWSLTDTLFSAREALEAAGHREAARRIERLAAEREAALLAARGFYQLVEARGQAFLAEESLERAASFLREVAAQVAAGAALESELLRAEARAARAQGRRVRAVAFRRRALRRLQTLLHAETPTSTVGVQVSFPDMQAPRFEPALAEARAKRPELRAARAALAAAVDEVDRASFRRLPDLTLSGLYRWARPNPRVIPPVDEFRDDWRVGVSLSWSPTAMWGLTEAVQAAQAQLREARARLALLDDDVRNQIADALANFRAARAALPAAQEEARAAQAAYEVRRTQYRLGAATLNDVVDSETDLTDARVRVLNAFIDVALARHTLRRAVGLDPVELPAGEPPSGG